ncbi:MAG: hypothetical protein KGZ75_13020 [Syntrophomonadaceae bacterium]|jgi:hypothetical protein|nr:hypothetical protein [Syntrophomonadaceae bacterium]
MIYFFLIVGLIMMVVAFRPTWNWLKNGSLEITPQPVIIQSDILLPEKKWLADEIKEMQVKLDLLTEATGELNYRVSKVDTRLNKTPALSAEAGFSRSLAREKNSSFQQSVCQAFDEGKDVNEIAREFNRGKGEIELVLSLRKSGKT